MTENNVRIGLPRAQGLYDPAFEHDACGIGFVASIKGQRSHDIIVKGIQVLINLTHRGACGCDPETGDGAPLWAEGGRALDSMLWPIARSAADLLTSGELEAVRQCGGRNCGWLFLDTSRNRTRR